MYVWETCHFTYIPQFSSSLSSSQSAWPSHLLEARTQRPELHLKWLGEHSVKSSGPYYCQQTENPDLSATLFIYVWDDVEKISLKIRMVLHQAEITKVYLVLFCLPSASFSFILGIISPDQLFCVFMLSNNYISFWTDNCWSLKCPRNSMLLTVLLSFVKLFPILIFPPGEQAFLYLIISHSQGLWMLCTWSWALKN